MAILTPPSNGPKFGTAAKIPKYTKAVIFAESGAGKTTLASTSPRPMLVINIDNSVASLPEADDIFIYPDPETENRPIASWKELQALVTWLENGGCSQFKTVVFDTMTEAGFLLKSDILSRPAVGGKRVTEKNMTQPEFGVYADEMLDLCRRLRDLPVNVVANAQCKDQTSDLPEGGIETLRYASFGEGQKAAQEAPALFDVIGYLSVEAKDGKLTRKLLTQPINNRRAKIRTKPGVVAPIGFTDPNLTEIFKLVTEG